jgi:hypothetical protein
MQEPKRGGSLCDQSLSSLIIITAKRLLVGEAFQRKFTFIASLVWSLFSFSGFAN